MFVNPLITDSNLNREFGQLANNSVAQNAFCASRDNIPVTSSETDAFLAKFDHRHQLINTPLPFRAAVDGILLMQDPKRMLTKHGRGYFSDERYEDPDWKYADTGIVGSLGYRIPWSDGRPSYQAKSRDYRPLIFNYDGALNSEGQTDLPLSKGSTWQTDLFLTLKPGLDSFEIIPRIDPHRQESEFGDTLYYWAQLDDDSIYGIRVGTNRQFIKPYHDEDPYLEDPNKLWYAIMQLRQFIVDHTPDE